MKTFFSGITMMASLAALALSGLTFFRVNTIEQQLPGKIAAAMPEAPVVSPSAAVDVEEVDDLAVESTDVNDVSTDAQTTPVEIQPGQFSQQGHDNQVKMEIVSLTRLPADEAGERDRVNVNLRVRRIVTETKGNPLVSFSRAKGRNPQTNEVYSTVINQVTKPIYLSQLSEEAWGDAYFWLKDVPDGSDSIDIIIPEMAIFEDVPISE